MNEGNSDLGNGHSLCLCGSGATYERCCGRFHSGESRPATAEALMRSRFTAFARRDEAYLLATWDAAKRPAAVDFSKTDVEWSRLEVVASKKGGVGDSKGVVQFRAFYRQNGEEYAINETSRFRKNQGRWFYLDGVVKSIARVGQESDQGLNAPCSCGSGKKFKRCCGKKHDAPRGQR